LFAVHRGDTGPRESLAAHANAVAKGRPASLDKVKVVVVRIDDSGARGLAGRVTDHRAPTCGIDGRFGGFFYDQSFANSMVATMDKATAVKPYRSARSSERVRTANIRYILRMTISPTER